MSTPEFAAALDRGVALFNAREFFEAHEVWEEEWREAEDEERLLLQGLIQVAAGFYKLQIGMPSGTWKLLEKGGARLRQIKGERHGLDLDDLLAHVDRWREVAQGMVERFQTAYDTNTLPTIQRHDG